MKHLRLHFRRYRSVLIEHRNRQSIPYAVQAIVEMMERRTLLSATGSISGAVYNDVNGDHGHQSYEPVLAGWGVYLDMNNNAKLDAGDIRVFSDAKGNYTFPNLKAGTYRIRQNTPAGWLHTNVTPFPFVVNLATGQKVTMGVNILNQQLGAATLVSNGTLYVTGTNGADHIGVGVSIDLDAVGNDVGSADVTINGAEKKFDADVSAVFISALAGNDIAGVGFGTDSGVTGIDISVPATVLGGAGNDQLSASLGGGDLNPAEPRVYMNGGDGNDIVDSYGDGSTTLHGGAGDDNLYAEGRATTTTVMYGDAANDNFDADLDANHATLNGGDGNDHFSVYGGAIQYVTIFGGAGSDTFDVVPNDGMTVLALDGHSHSQNIVLGSDMENVVGDVGADTAEFIGNAANNYVSVAGVATLLGGAGNDTLVSGNSENWLYGGDGNDLLIPALQAINHLSGGAGTDAVDYTKHTGNLRIYLDGSQPSTDSPDNGTDYFDGTVERVYGGSGNDLIVGNNSNDALFGYGGDDTLVAGSGHNALWGGDGNDLILARNDNSDYINGGNGDDTAQVDAVDTVVDVEHIQQTPATLLPDGTLYIVGTDSTDTINIEIDQSVTVVTNSQEQDYPPSTVSRLVVYGLGGDDTIKETGSQMVSLGLQPVGSTVFGGNGNDKISDQALISAPDGYSLTVSDSLDGGNGNDTITADNDGLCTANGEAGNDTLYGMGTLRSPVINLLGGDGNDVLVAASAGSEGFPSIGMSGGAGDDKFKVEDPDIGFGVDGGSGSDTFDLTNFFGRTTLDLQGTSVENVIGVPGNDVQVTANDGTQYTVHSE